MNTRFTFPLAVLLVLASALAGCSSSKSSGGTYSPPVTPGKELSSGNVVSGGNFAHTFNTAGTFPYHCGLHPTIMFGAKVMVSDTAAATSAAVTIVSVSTPGFSPATVSVKTGSIVTWHNADGMAHSVESD